jgi:MOSC domain-containing protein YiiM
LVRFLGRDDLTPGSVGENFTVDGMPDDEVCVGDRYRIGGALFEITQPRVTCFQDRVPAAVVLCRSMDSSARSLG